LTAAVVTAGTAVMAKMAKTAVKASKAKMRTGGETHKTVGKVAEEESK